MSRSPTQTVIEYRFALWQFDAAGPEPLRNDLDGSGVEDRVRQMRNHWEFSVRGGTFKIIPDRDGFQLMFEDEALGFYRSASAALDDLTGGHCDWPSIGDPSRLGIPDDLGEWTFVRK